MQNLSKTTELNITRTIKATPEEIYSVWLDSTRPGSPWYGVNRAIVNPVQNGLFYHSVQHEGHDWAHYGRFLVLEKNKKIQLTWVSEATHGFETVLTVTIESQGGQTLVKIHHTNVPDTEMGRQHEMGWNYVLDALKHALEKDNK